MFVKESMLLSSLNLYIDELIAWAFGLKYNKPSVRPIINEMIITKETIIITMFLLVGSNLHF